MNYPNWIKDFIEFLRFKTYKKDEKEKASKWLKNYLENLGFDVEIIYSENETPNILAKYPTNKSKKYVFVTHFDVVPPGDGWKFDPFEPKIIDNKIYARGAADDKSAIFSSIYGILDADINSYPILAIAGGEETQESEEFFNEIYGDLIFVVDTGLYTSIGSSGFLGINLKIKGKQAHSAYLYRGRNSIYLAKDIINLIEILSNIFEETFKSKYKFIEYYNNVPVRMSITKISAKPNVINIIPGEVEMYINIRTVPEYDNDFIYELVKNIVIKYAKSKNIEIEIERDKLEMPPWVNDGEFVDRFIELNKDIVGEKKILELGGTDGYHFYKRGLKVIQFGPMREENNIHGPNEFVYIEDILKVYEIIKRVVEKL